MNPCHDFDALNLRTKCFHVLRFDPLRVEMVTVFMTARLGYCDILIYVFMKTVTLTHRFLRRIWQDINTYVIPFKRDIFYFLFYYFPFFFSPFLSPRNEKIAG